MAAIAADASTTMEECPSENQAPTPNGRSPLLHHFAGDVINRRNVVGVDRVAQAVAPGQQTGGHQRAAVDQTPATPIRQARAFAGDKYPEPAAAARGCWRKNHSHIMRNSFETSRRAAATTACP